MLICILHLFFFDCVGIQWICLSLSDNKLLKRQQLVHSLLQTPPVTVCHIMSCLSKTNICTCGHAQLCWLCHIIQSDIFNVYQSPAPLFYSFYLSFSALCQHKRPSQLQQSPFPLFVSSSWCGCCYRCYAQIIGPFIFRVLGYLYPLEEPYDLLFVRFI